MPTSRPFAYNTSGVNISGTYNVGSLCVGNNTSRDFDNETGGLTWWYGPDEELGYCIGKSVTTQNQPTPIGNVGNVGFWRTNGFSDSAFLNLVKAITGRNFENTPSACAYLVTNGYWTSFNNLSVSYFLVSNRASYVRWTEYGEETEQITYVEADSIPSYKLYQKPNPFYNNVGTYQEINYNQVGSPAKLTWRNVQYVYSGGLFFTDVNVYKSGSIIAYGFPNGGDATYDVGVYIDIIQPFVT